MSGGHWGTGAAVLCYVCIRGNSSMTVSLDAYFGTDEVRALQQAQDHSIDALRETPGAVIHARTFSTDDPLLLGWDRLRDRMRRDGRVTLRGVAPDVLGQALEALADLAPTQHHWDIFMGDAGTIADACRPLAARDLPDGLHRVPDDRIDDGLLHKAQRFLTDHGVSPFSKDALAGRLFPAQMVILGDAQDQIRATGFAAMTHNRYSPFAGIAWVGLIAVAPELRGQDLGKYVDALTNLVALDRLGATGTMEFVARDNIPSRRMLEACGLRNRADIAVTMLSLSGHRLTR